MSEDLPVDSISRTEVKLYTVCCTVWGRIRSTLSQRSQDPYSLQHVTSPVCSTIVAPEITASINANKRPGYTGFPMI